MQFKTIIEPFRIKVVEPIKMTTREDRVRFLREAGLNVFLLKSEDVLIDLLTDSGTTAMSAEQWSAMMRGDESYAGAPSYYRFHESIYKLTGFKEIIPTHQGRAAERILFQSVCKPGQVVISNMFFDTTRANAETSGLVTVDIPCKEYYSPMVPAPFKGNIDLEKLEELLRLRAHLGEIGLVLMTITNNSGGGQPVSMGNLRAAGDLCRRYKVNYVIDACRFAENAKFIKLREQGYAGKSSRDIAKEIFSLCDAISVSAKKDGMGNIGGFLAMHNQEWAQACRNNLILTEGFVTYGGLAGRDLEAIAVGINEAVDDDYLTYRLQCVNYVGQGLLAQGWSIVNPPGGHAIYLDAKAMLPHISVDKYPAQVLTSALYEFAGIRGVEIGSVMLGREMSDGHEQPHSQELVRLAIPRRVYTQAHMDYLLEATAEFKKTLPQLRGVRFTYKPKVLRHFTARFEWC
ncbi:MAG: tryptophanase [Oligoflexia bacterium]|nr:tryptophanase [Oligoflexia bacterium]MBF0364457.1 tryptophanase [Oligoflexia bacterium]